MISFEKSQEKSEKYLEEELSAGMSGTIELAAAHIRDTQLLAFLYISERYHTQFVITGTEYDLRRYRLRGKL